MAYKRLLNFKLLFIIFVFIVVFVFFVLQILLQGKKENISENENKLKPGLPVTSALPVSLFKTLLYQVEYPKDWNYEKFNTVGGNSVVFKPLSNPSDDYYPGITVSFTKDATILAGNSEKIYLMTGFQKTTAIINNYVFTKYSGIFSKKIIAGKAIEKPVRQSIFILQKDNIKFTIKYQYEGIKPDENMETMFNGILSTFRFL